MRHIVLFCIAWTIPWSGFALVNGQPLVGKPDLVRLEFNGRDSVCSGFFISPNLIVTAAHCLYSWRDETTSKLTGIISTEEKNLALEVLEMISHPNYEKGWATHDLAVIKVKNNSSYEGNFVISKLAVPRWGNLIYFGAGKIDMEKNIYGRSTGEAQYLKLGTFILGFGPSKKSEKFEGSASIAANDSGSPVVQKETNKVIAVASKSTAITTSGSFLTAISISTSLEEDSNKNFILKFIDREK